MSNNKGARNARTPTEAGPYYVLAEGAPKHYIDGFGLCFGGALFTLAPGVEPGIHMVEITADEYQKASGDESFAMQLAAVAKVKASQRRLEDLQRKRQRDQATEASRTEAQIAEAEAAAAAMQKAADEERKAQDEAKGRAEAEERAKAAEEALKAERERLAAAEKELEKFREASGSAKPADEKKK
jgi:hypothetical protein